MRARSAKEGRAARRFLDTARAFGITMDSGDGGRPRPGGVRARRHRNMKNRFWALLALVALAVPSVSHAGPGWVWIQLRFPAVGAYGGNGAYGDTSFFSMTSATATATAYFNNAGTQDTTKAFWLPNWTTGLWAQADTMAIGTGAAAPTMMPTY